MLRRAREVEAAGMHALLWSAKYDIPLVEAFQTDPYRQWVADHCKRKLVWVVAERTKILGTMVSKFYILGVTEGTSVAAGVANDKAHFCIPEGVSASAMELVVKMAIGQDLMVFPADREIPAVSFVAAAMQKAFPCGPSTAPK